MKVKLLAAAIILSASSSSFAGEDWNGFYAGGALGVASFTSDFNDLDDDWDNQGLSGDNSLDLNTGIYAGINFQLDSLVYGVEIGHTRYGSKSTGLPNADDNVVIDDSQTTELESAISLRVRAGLAAGNTLLFLAVGPTWAKTNYKSIYENAHYAKGDDTILGLTTSVGIEQKFTPSISARLQVEHTAFETSDLITESESDYRYSHDDALTNVLVGVSYNF
jgi:opacity protein-like surface antigen